MANSNNTKNSDFVTFTINVGGNAIVKGPATVMIGGVPAARLGDQTANGGAILLGALNVMIGG